MGAFVFDENVTRDGDLATWNAFCLAYYDPILRALRLLRVPEADAGDLAHSFLVKVAEKDFLGTFRAFQEKEARNGRRARFRTYLYRSIRNHVHDYHRRHRSDARPYDRDSEAVQALAAEPETTLDPDAIYALDVLHQALQALRRHCERTGKPHFWVFFEETYLANEFRGRRGKTRAELLAAHPDFNPQRFDNALTTAKRAFRRFVEEVIPRGLRDDVGPEERFEEWMSILRDSNASQFNLLHLAYRVIPHMAPDSSQAASTAMVVDSPHGLSTTCVYEEPVMVPDEDELNILLGFQLELPLTEMLDPAELTQYIPSSSTLWSLPMPSSQPSPGTGNPAHRPVRPTCLLTLIDPSPAEAAALARTDLLGLLARLKTMSKQLRRRPDHNMPEVFAQLLYTLANLLAFVRCGHDLHTIGPASLAGNVRWFLKQSWMDDRIRPFLVAGLASLEGQTDADARNLPEA